MRKLIALAFIFIYLCLGINLFAQGEKEDTSQISRGVWVTVFSQKKVLYSKKAARDLINLCKEANLNEIYLQIYQSGNAYYDSRVADRTKYEDILKNAGTDTIDFLLKEAQSSNIKVFAWLNLLSLGNNDKADLIRKFGKEVLTQDQYLRPSGKDSPNESDKYYLREELLFLEPGDQRAARYLISIVEEVIDRYPFNGVHLDYVRYPMTVPFIPGSRFTKYGLSYGYGRENIERFRAWTGLDPLKGLKSNSDYAKWDDWRRQQVTSLVRRIAKHVKEKSPGLLVSCAAIFADERAYLSVFQDWPYWLEDRIVDYVVLMNYTLDNQLTKEVIRSSSGYRNPGKVFIGIGLYLMKDNPAAFMEQYRIVQGLNPDGTVIFSYDDITDEIARCLRQP